jgi:hypothetical protein
MDEDSSWAAHEPSRNAKRIGSIKFWLTNTSANASTLTESGCQTKFFHPF